MQTTIQLKKETLERLKKFKEFNKESYDEIINKMMAAIAIQENKLDEDEIKNIKKARFQKSKPLSKIIKELGLEV